MIYGRVSFRALVIHERTEKILVTTDYCLPSNAGQLDRFYIGLRGCAVYIHALLIALAES